MMYMADSFYVPAQSNPSPVSSSAKPSGDTSKPVSSSDFQQLLTERAQDTTQNTDLLEQAPATPSQPDTDSDATPESLAQGLVALLLMQPIPMASMQTQAVSTPPVQQQVLASAASALAPMPAPTLGKTIAPTTPVISQSVPESAAIPVPTQTPQTAVSASTVLAPVPPQVSQAQPQPQLQVQPQNQGQLPVQDPMQNPIQAQVQGQAAPSSAVNAPQQPAPQNTQATDASTGTPVVTASSATVEQDKPELLLQNEASAKPLFSDSKHLPVKVGEAQTLDTQSSDFDQQLSKQVSDALKQGEQKLSLRLAPKELGTIVVEMTRSQDGSLQVMLRASTAAATTLLTDRSAELSGLLRGSTQAPVFVEVQQLGNAQQQQQQQEQQQGNAHHNQQQQQQQQQQTHKQTQDFLDQLRLGLLPFDGEVS